MTNDATNPVTQADMDAADNWRLYWQGCYGDIEALYQAFALHRIASRATDKTLAADDGAGVPVSDWAWWVGDAESVEAEGLYDLYEAASLDDALEYASANILPGEPFYVIEARTRCLLADDEYQPFAATRSKARYVVNDVGEAILTSLEGQG